MLRFVNLDIAESLAFVDDPGVSRPHGEEMLREFLSLRKRNLLKLSGAEGFAGFAQKYGSLEGPGEAVSVPAGARAFMADLPSEVGSATGGELFFEPASLWRFHVDAMRDIALLHAFLRHLPVRRKTTGVRILQANCIAFDAAAGSKACIYHGTTGLHPSGASFRKPGRRVPDDVRAYLEAIGGGFSFSAGYRSRSDSIEGKEEWLALNGEAVMSAYLDDYLELFPGKEGSLLAELQSMLVELVSQDRPLTFCILCGGVASREAEEFTMNFDGNQCRALHYRVRDEVASALVDTGYTAEQAERLLNTKRTDYRKARRQ